MARLGNIVNSIKHYIQFTNTSTPSGTSFTVDLVEAVVAPAAAATKEVTEGSIVKALFIEFWLWLGSASGQDGQFNFIISKQPAGQVDPTSTNMLNLQAFPNKKNILFVSQGVLGAGIDGSPSLPVVRQWFKVPKGKQRMGLGDRISITMLPTGQPIQLCGFSTYKEYR